MSCPAPDRRHFHEAAIRQVQELNDITQNIQTSGTQYTTADDDQAANLSSAMNL